MDLATNAIVVGADRLGNIPDVLKGYNIRIKHHVTGRETAHQKKNFQLPSGVGVLILLTDFLGHNVMKSFRCAAQKAGVPVLACRRSVCSVQDVLNKNGYCMQCDKKASCPKMKMQ